MNEEPEDLIQKFREDNEANQRYWSRWWKLYGSILMVLVPLQLAVLVLWALVK